MKKNIIVVLSLVLMMGVLASCGSSDKTTSSNGKEEIYTVSSHPFSTTLFYSGVVQPYKTFVITAPTEGVVQETLFHYGDVVKSGQLLFTLSSDKFQTDYKNALMQYLKSKNEFDTSRSQLKESEFLHKNELISDDDYKTKQTSFYNAQLSLMQAKDTLMLMLKQLDVKGLKLDDLSIENIEKVNQILHSQGEGNQLRITAPVSGVILLQTKGDTGDSDSKKVGKGDSVKQGDVLAVIGDVGGLTIHANG